MIPVQVMEEGKNLIRLIGISINKRAERKREKCEGHAVEVIRTCLASRGKSPITTRLMLGNDTRRMMLGNEMECRGGQPRPGGFGVGGREERDIHPLHEFNSLAFKIHKLHIFIRHSFLGVAESLLLFFYVTV